MKPVLIDFHSLVTVWAPQLTEGLQAFLARQFPLLLREDLSAPPGNPEIIVKPMEAPPQVTDIILRTSALFGFSIFRYQDQIAVGTIYRGSPDLLITASDPMTVLYRPRTGIDGRFYAALLFAIQLCLRNKNALLMHGAVVEKGGQSILLSGHRGTGKTQLLLSLLNRGWNYLSDDKFILHGGIAYLFESRVYVNDHLQAGLPWLRSIVSGSSLQHGTTQLRQKLRPIVHRILTRRSPHAVERVLDPAAQYDVQNLFPACSVRTQAAADHGFLLFQGRDFSISEIPRHTAIEGLSNIVSLLFTDMEPMERMLALYAKREWASLPELISQNLPNVPFYKVLLPESPSPEEVCQEILACCEVQ